MTDEEKIIIAARITALEHAFVGLLTDLAMRQEHPWETVNATIEAICTVSGDRYGQTTTTGAESD